MTRPASRRPAYRKPRTGFRARPDAEAVTAPEDAWAR